MARCTWFGAKAWSRISWGRQGTHSGLPLEAEEVGRQQENILLSTGFLAWTGSNWLWNVAACLPGFHVLLGHYLGIRITSWGPFTWARPSQRSPCLLTAHSHITMCTSGYSYTSTPVLLNHPQVGLSASTASAVKNLVMRPLQKLIENTHSFPRGQIGTHKHMQGLSAHTDIQMQVHKYTLTNPEANANSHTSA
jgi:hypothetical protein